MKNILKQAFTVFIVLSLLFSLPAFAANDENTNSAVRFYIHCLNGDKEELINISNVSTSLDKNIKLDSDFKLSIGNGVTEKDILSYLTKEPDNDKILKKLQQMFDGEEKYISTKDGKIYDISELTGDKFDIEWYCIYFDEKWCVNGRIVDASTGEEVNIYDGSAGNEDGNTDIFPEYTSNHAYIFGYNDTQMGAEGPLLRSEISAMIYRLAKQNNRLDGFVYDESKSPVYADISGEWFRSAIEFMEYKGAFDTTEGNNINPYTKITRGEAFKLICIGLDFTKDTSLDIQEYAKIMKQAGYIQGDENGDLNESKLISRAEFCTIYNRVIGRDKAKLITEKGEKISSQDYGFTDLSGDEWYYETMLKATSAYDENGYVDIEARGIRNDLDDYK